MDKLIVYPAREIDLPDVYAMRRRHFDRYGVPETPRQTYTYMLCRTNDHEIYACLGYREEDEGIIMDDLFAEPTRLGKAAAGVILRWIHDFADARGKTLCGVTMHAFIVEHALRRGWQVAGMALVRPVGGS